MFEYIPGDSFLHKLDVRTKVFVFLILTSFSFIFKSPVAASLIALISILLAASGGLSISKIIEKLKPLAIIFIFMLFMTGFSYSPDYFVKPESQQILFTIWNSIPFTVGGFLLGITLLLRMIIMVITSTLLIYTTPLNDFLQLMEKISMPYQLAFVLTTAIRFIPTLEQKSEKILHAQKARGSQIGNGKFFTRIRSYIPIMIPLITEAMRMSENLAIGMLNRGYGANEQTTSMYEIQMNKIDYLVIFGSGILTVWGIYLWLRGFGTL